MISNNYKLPCGATLPNRIAKAAMSEELSNLKGTPEKSLCQLYKTWAEGGTGLLITGNVMIDERFLENPRNAILNKDSDLNAFREWTTAGTSNGNHLWIQLNHTGRQTPRFVNPEPVAPSAGRAVKQFRLFGDPRELKESEIHQIIQQFADSAKLAKDVGFTGVQIHGAHGYLVSQFLTPLVNKREDQWGGSLYNRSRFIREVIKAVRSTVGESFPIGVKLNSSDFQKGGFNQDESIEVIRMLEDLGVDLIELSGGNYESPAMFDLQDSSRQREAYFLDYARSIRQASKIPLMVTGGFRSKPTMDDAITTDALDIIGIGRPLALEPDLPNLMFRGESQGSTITPRSFGHPKINYFAEGGFYLAQMGLLSRGKKTNPELGTWHAAAIFVWQQIVDRLGYRSSETTELPELQENP